MNPEGVKGGLEGKGDGSRGGGQCWEIVGSGKLRKTKQNAQDGHAERNSSVEKRETREGTWRKK